MKRNQSFWITIFSVAMLLSACKKDDPPTPSNSSPTAAVLTTPADAATGVSNTPTLSWQASTDADGDAITYDVLMDENSNPSTSVASSISATSFAVAAALTIETTYFWKVVSKDGNGGSATSETRSFTTKDNSPPNSFNLLLPANSATNVESSPSLSWEEALDPDGDEVIYDFYLDQSTNPSTLIAANLTSPLYEFVTLLSGETTYYWKVVAKDGNGGETTSATFNYTTRGLVEATQYTDAPWAARAQHSSVVFNNKMWVLGGRTCCGGRYDDVWSSSDGENWTLVTDDPGWVARAGHASVVYDNKMWVIGGQTTSSQAGTLSDVWYSEDGETWTMATDQASFGKRTAHNLLSYNGKMWIVSGQDQDQSYSRKQVWSSADGINWTLETDDAGLNLIYSEIVEFNNKFWRMGSLSDTKVYSSVNMVDWTEETDNVPWGQRYNHTSVVWDNQLWLISGSDKLINQLQELPDVWVTVDGINWERAAQDAGFQPVAEHTSVVFNNSIWILGGGGGWQSNVVLNHVYGLN